MADPKCPVCEQRFGGGCFSQMANASEKTFTCEYCGTFRASDHVLVTGGLRSLTIPQRAALSRSIKRSQAEPGEMALLDQAFIDRFQNDFEPENPNDALWRFFMEICLLVLESGEPVFINSGVKFAEMGAVSVQKLIFEFPRTLLDYELLSSSVTLSGETVLSPTFKGWETYQARKSGRGRKSYGFIAMKFGDETLEPLVRDTIKPLIKTLAGYDVRDVRDHARAGVIDNLIREDIRDAAFAIVDLTHDNSGAYWEAGYAEGLGLPVIYICEEAKFNSEKTHFDTNHCQTVLWGREDDTDNEKFGEVLAATVRRSLDLF